MDYYGRQALTTVGRRSTYLPIYEQMHPGGLHCEASRLAAEKHSPVGVGSGILSLYWLTTSHPETAEVLQLILSISTVFFRGNMYA